MSGEEVLRSMGSGSETWKAANEGEALRMGESDQVRAAGSPGIASVSNTAVVMGAAGLTAAAVVIAAAQPRRKVWRGWHGRCISS